jgi:hypothetical protein
MSIGRTKTKNKAANPTNGTGQLAVFADAKPKFRSRTRA